MRLYTREQAIKLTSLESIKLVDSVDCYLVNRLNRDKVEYQGSIDCMHIDGRMCTLTAYYYIADADCIELVDWSRALAGYMII